MSDSSSLDTVKRWYIPLRHVDKPETELSVRQQLEGFGAQLQRDLGKDVFDYDYNHGYGDGTVFVMQANAQTLDEAEKNRLFLDVQYRLTEHPIVEKLQQLGIRVLSSFI